MDRKQGIGKHSRRNAAAWQKLITDWRSSGRTRRDWCREHGVSYESLRRWIKRVGRTPGGNRLVEVAAAGEAMSATIRVHAGDGLVVELPPTSDEKLLGRVLRAVREAGHVR
ncbi:MAG: transposase [Opitutaceae bacterium]